MIIELCYRFFYSTFTFGNSYSIVLLTKEVFDMTQCFLTSNFFLRNQEFVIYYYSGFCKLYANVNYQLVFISDCLDSETAKERAKFWMGEE